MKTFRTLGCALAALLTCITASAQYYNLTFRGTCYQTDSSGNIVPTPLTERTFIETAAGGTPTNELSIVYHIESGGDSVKVIRNSDGGNVMQHPFFQFLFGEDSTLGRSALTNATQTEIRRVDYVYTQNTTTYSSWNTHSIGAVFITKRIMTDAQNNVRQSVDGQQMQWIVLPQGSSSTKVCVGNFQTGAPWVKP